MDEARAIAGSLPARIRRADAVGAGIVNGSNVPRSLEESRINLYRWTWAAAFLTYAALGLGFAAVSIGRARSDGPAGASARATPCSSWSRHSWRRRSCSFPETTTTTVSCRTSRSRNASMTPCWPGSTARGPCGSPAPETTRRLSVGPHLISPFDRGRRQGRGIAALDCNLRAEPNLPPTSRPQIVVVTSGKAEPPSGPGELLAIEPFGPAPSAEYDRLADRAC